MEYTKLGRTGLHISRFALGTMNFGRYTDEKDAFRMMDMALDAGINFFDTSNSYGFGAVEEVIGRWFALGGGRREKVVLATKVYALTKDENDGPNECFGLSAYKIRRHLNASLRRLQTDHIELYQMHHVDREVGWDELYGAFEVAVAQGKIDYVGSSNFAARDMVRAQYEARARGFLGLVAEQHKYSLLCRLPELEVLPAAEELGMAILPWGPLAAGLLGGNALARQENTRSVRNEMTPQLEKQLTEYAALCQKLGHSEANVALAWMLHNPQVTAPIIGPRSPQQFTDTLKALDIRLDEEALAQLDAIFPGPGAEAPRAYAW